MAEYQINLKYGVVDDWRDLPINNYNFNYDNNVISQKNADGNLSYLNLGSVTKSSTLSTPPSNQYLIKAITNYLISSMNEAEIKIDGAIHSAYVTNNYSKQTANLENVTTTFNVTIINE